MAKKFVNPVEKARKRAKKNEAKKQKKQRFEARSLNLKGKDVHVIIGELERLDQIQYSVEEAPKLNAEVIENKRKKLKETLGKIMGMYKKEDPATFDQIKRLEMNYEGKRVNLVKRYEAVNSAKQVNLEEIPLPFCGDDMTGGLSATSTSYRPARSSLTRSSTEQCQYITVSGEVRNDLKPPGCPALVPPSIEQLEEELKRCGKSLDSVNAEKDLDEFLKEVDRVEQQVSTKDQTNEPLPTSRPLHNLPKMPVGMPPIPPPMMKNVPPPALPKQPGLNPASSTLPNPINPAPFPGLLNPMGLLNAPPPQMKRPPNAPPPPFNKHPMTGNPHFSKFNPSLKHQLHPPSAAAAAAGQIRKEPEKVAQQQYSQQQGATIEAKPQLRNLSADVTKFLPTSLRIKRQDTTKRPARPNDFSARPSAAAYQNRAPQNKPAQPDQKPSKDAAYEEFMKELSGLI